MSTKKHDEPQAVQVRRKGAEQSGADLGELKQNVTLTRRQLRVLDVLVDPTTAGKTDDELAEMAGMSRTTFWRIKSEPAVEAERMKLCKALITSRVAPIIHKSIMVATSEGRDGFQDRRLLLAMSGDYQERKQHDVNVNGQMMVGVVGVALDSL
jgi:predicted DNA-binding protein (UPF0251 family)